ncbi:MAG: cytochrome c oxidase accessory protein CcoG [Imperialibacter sp.]|uniref:cytochrome c oxidase accessory protein CcoG n=1 Tax=Imperialibacter sp. TaxID=2038411 RepID=UPI0032EB75C3
MEDLYEYDELYRDTIATVDEQGKRVWINPKKPKGRYHTYRIAVTVLLLGLLFGAPFLSWKGHPMFLFNIFERKFILFGTVFWPQDFIIFGIGMIAFFVFVILFTVVFGRIWCGWMCPQTIFMEMVFRKIEYWIEGDANQQRKLARQDWNFEKIWKKGLKLSIFLGISALIAHTLMAYLIGIDEVITIVSQPPTAHMAGFIGLIAFTGIFFWVFAYFREQACIAVCPYGRLQGVLLDKESIVVAYNWLRGEPRGKIKKEVTGAKAEPPKGDCIDCKLCVHVCPTGIDIRNGTQLECVNCTACIDACDEVMTKVDRPTGLIGYYSHSMVSEGKKFSFNTRIAAYTAVLVGILGLLAFLLTTRTDVEATMLRVPGMLYQEKENGMISNLYNIQFVNKTYEDIHIEVKLKDANGGTIDRVGGEGLVIPAASNLESVYFIDLPRENVTETSNKLVIQLYRDGELLDEIKTNFLGPFKQKKP